jgi:hypothetical protein
MGYCFHPWFAEKAALFKTTLPNDGTMSGRATETGS